MTRSSPLTKKSYDGDAEVDENGNGKTPSHEEGRYDDKEDDNSMNSKTTTWQERRTKKTQRNIRKDLVGGVGGSFGARSVSKNMANETTTTSSRVEKLYVKTKLEEK